MVFMLLTFVLGLRLTMQENPTNKGLTLFFIAVLFLVCSKIQNAPVGLAFMLIFGVWVLCNGKGASGSWPGGSLWRLRLYRWFCT